MSTGRTSLTRFMAIFAGGTMLSRVLGLVRTMLMAYLLPPGPCDVFTVAFKFPNMLRDLVGEGASNAAFIPVFSEYKEREGDESFRKLIQTAMGAMIVLLGTLTIVGIGVLQFLPHMLQALGTFTPQSTETGVSTTLYTQTSVYIFPYIFLIGLTIFAMGPLFVSKHYGTPSWSPALLNVSLIPAIVIGSYFVNPVTALVVGVWIGGLAQLFVMFRALRKYCGVWRPRFDFVRHPGVKKMAWLLGPVLIGQAAGEVNKLVDTLFAARLAMGTPFALQNANLLVQLPLSIFGLAVAAAILPSMSASSSRKAHDEVRTTIMSGLRQSAFLIAPSMMGLIVLRGPIVRLMFEHGAFRPLDTELTVGALGFYAAGLLSFAWVKVTVTGFYAMQDTRTPVLIASAAMFLNILLNFALVGPMQHLGLALATTISFTANFALLYIMLCGRLGWLWDGAFLDGLARIAIATAMMAAVGYGVYTVCAAQWGIEGLFPKFAVALLPIFACVAVYFTVCRLLNVREMNDFIAAVSRRL